MVTPGRADNNLRPVEPGDIDRLLDDTEAWLEGNVRPHEAPGSVVPARAVSRRVHSKSRMRPSANSSSTRREAAIGRISARSSSSSLRDHDRPISYLTSDPADPGLAIADPRFRAFNIGSGTARTILFARMDCRHFVMTLPDLGNLWLKRSVHPVHYIYLFHSMNSTHTSYRTGAFDQFDTILCVGPHHVNEIRATEAAYGLPAKELVEHGSAKLDALLAEIGDRGATAAPG